MNNPAPFVNSPPPRRGPGCWAIGGVTCLVVLILGALVILGGTYSFLHSPGGRKAGATFGKIFSGAQEEAGCLQKMQAVHDAILRYHISKGVYPKDLTALVPDFITDPAVLHCPLDPNPDPKHVTFVYARPAEGAPDTTPLLAFTADITVALEGQTQTNETKMTMTLGGKVVQSQKITQNGKTVSRTAPL